MPHRQAEFLRRVRHVHTALRTRSRCRLLWLRACMHVSLILNPSQAMLSTVLSPVHACSPSANYADVQHQSALQLHVSGAPSEEIDIDLADFTQTHEAERIKSANKGCQSNTVPPKKKHKPMSEVLCLGRLDTRPTTDAHTHGLIDVIDIE